MHAIAYSSCHPSFLYALLYGKCRGVPTTHVMWSLKHVDYIVAIHIF